MGDSGLRIGQVCDLLRDEFPDVTISKLRFLQEKGLVDPRRTPGGYRIYDDHDVSQLRQILRMQRDEFLPLKVIRDELARRVAGEAAAPAAAAPQTITGVVAAAASAAGAAGTGRLSLTAPDELIPEAEVCRKGQVSLEFLNACRDGDLVRGVVADDGTVAYTRHEAGIVHAAGQLHQLGLDVRHLHQVRSAAGRQAGLVEQYATARLHTRNAEARAQAIRNVESMTQLMADFMRLAFTADVRASTARTLAAAGEATHSGPARPIITAG